MSSWQFLFDFLESDLKTQKTCLTLAPHSLRNNIKSALGQVNRMARAFLGNLSIKFSGTQLYTEMERGTGMVCEITSQPTIKQSCSQSPCFCRSCGQRNRHFFFNDFLIQLAMMTKMGKLSKADTKTTVQEHCSIVDR